MKIQIRYGCFETNSSSTHSLVIASKREFDEFRAGDVYLNNWELDDRPKLFMTKEEVIECIVRSDYRWSQERLSSMDKDEFDSLIGRYDFFSFESFGDGYDWMEESATTEHGDEVVAFGYYGHD